MYFDTECDVVDLVVDLVIWNMILWQLIVNTSELKDNENIKSLGVLILVTWFYFYNNIKFSKSQLIDTKLTSRIVFLCYVSECPRSQIKILFFILMLGRCIPHRR